MRLDSRTSCSVRRSGRKASPGRQSCSLLSCSAEGPLKRPQGADEEAPHPRAVRWGGTHRVIAPSGDSWRQATRPLHSWRLSSISLMVYAMTVDASILRQFGCVDCTVEVWRWLWAMAGLGIRPSLGHGNQCTDQSSPSGSSGCARCPTDLQYHRRTTASAGSPTAYSIATLDLPVVSALSFSLIY